MKALTWQGKRDVRVERVPDPTIEKPDDIIIRVTASAICGSDLHLYDHFMLGMEKGDVMGHEFMGEVVETGSGVNGRLKVGERVVVPFQVNVVAPSRCGMPFSQSRPEPPRRKSGTTSQSSGWTGPQW